MTAPASSAPGRPPRGPRIPARELRLFGAALVLVGIAAVAVRAGWRAVHPPPTTNIVFVLVDTLRADRVGIYGGPNATTTPAIDALARESIVFDRAYSPSSWTTPSLASLFLGQRPFEHRVQQFLVPLPDDPLLAEVLRDAGYATGAFTANTSITGLTGFDRGFAAFRMVEAAGDPVFGVFGHADAAAVNAEIVRWLDAPRDPASPVFLFVQYMEPHAPYQPHEGVTALRHPALALSDDDLSRRPLLGPWRVDEAERKELWRLSIGQTFRLRQLYDGEVTYVDGQIEVLLDQLERRGLLRDAIVVLTSDHGEELGEHGLFGHGMSLYENETRVPLIVRLPGARPTGRVTRPVETVGLAAALLREVGVEVPGTFREPALVLEPDTTAPAADADGSLPFAVSELEPIRGYGVGLHRRTAATRGEKVFEMAAGGFAALNLQTDREELQLRPLEEGDVELRRALERIAAAERRKGDAPAALPVDPASRKRLEALGYLVGGEPPLTSPTASP